ncbi:MAG TPA: SDR family oxidoreductase [Polyangiaceae bacterium]
MSAGRLLVSGFPGFRARAVLRVALEAEPDARPVVLVHPARRADADAALAALAGGERVELLEGDPAAIDFGLDRKSYAELAETVTHLQHLYQVTDLGAPVKAAESANIGGTREIIEFGRVARSLERIVHHSSVFVSGDRTGTVRESELTAGQAFHSPVARSLALAEAMLSRHPELPLTVVRAGQIVGDSRSGEVDQLDGPYPLLVFLASAPRGSALPLPPRADSPLHLVPVDFVARAAHRLLSSPGARKKTVHLVDPEPLSARRFLELSAARFGQRLEPGFNAAGFGRALLGNRGVGLLVQNLRTVTDLITTPVSYDDSVARAELAGSGIVCPPLESYLDVLLSHLEERVKQQRLNERGKEAWDVAG